MTGFRVAYERIDQMGATTALPLILWLRDLPAHRLPMAEHREAVITVESYLARRVAIGASTRAYNQVFGDLLEGVRQVETQDSVSIPETIAENLAAVEGGNRWPSDEEVAEAFRTRQFYNSVAQYLIRLLLAAVDARLQEENPLTEEATVDYHGLTVEHLLPQSWKEHWPIEAESEAEQILAGQNRDSYLHRIGNLTLINGSLNAKQSNAGWTTKRTALGEHSALRLNAELVTDHRWDDWDEAAITARAEYLAEIVCRVLAPRHPTSRAGMPDALGHRSRVSIGISRIGASVGLDLITVTEAARLLVVTDREVHQLMADGVSTQYRRGRETLLDRTEVEGHAM